MLRLIQASVLLPDSSLPESSFKMTSSLLSNHQDQDALLATSESSLEEKELPTGDGDGPQELPAILNDYYRALAEVMMSLDPAQCYACSHHGCAAVFLDSTSLVLHEGSHLVLVPRIPIEN